MTPSQELPGDPTTMVFAVPLAGTTVRRAIRISTPMVPVRQRSHSSENLPRWIRWSPRTSESEVPKFFFRKAIWNKQQSFQSFPLLSFVLGQWEEGLRIMIVPRKKVKWWNKSKTRKQTWLFMNISFWRLQISPSKKNSEAPFTINKHQFQVTRTLRVVQPNVTFLEMGGQKCQWPNVEGPKNHKRWSCRWLTRCFSYLRLDLDS